MNASDIISTNGMQWFDANNRDPILLIGLQHIAANDGRADQLLLRVGQNVAASSLWLLLVSAALSALILNIPLVAALTPLLLDTCQRAGLLQAGGLPMADALPLFKALMLGVVIGGSGTGISSSSNLMAAGVASQQGSRLGFCTWLSYGLPTVGLQLLVAWLWCWHVGR